MPKLTLTAILRDGEAPIPLMTEAEEARAQVALDETEARIRDCAAPELAGQRLALLSEKRRIQADIETNQKLKAWGNAKEIVISWREPTLGDRRAILEVAKTGEIAAVLDKAFDLLAPTCPEFKEIPLALFDVVASACLSSIEPQPSDDRRFFSIRSQPG